MQEPVRVQISNLSRPHQFQELRESRLLSLEHLYQKGTDPEYYLNLQDRESADLLVANLQALGYRARVL
jgi:hypothetical protein